MECCQLFFGETVDDDGGCFCAFACDTNGEQEALSVPGDREVGVCVNRVNSCQLALSTAVNSRCVNLCQLALCQL